MLHHAPTPIAYESTLDNDTGFPALAQYVTDDGDDGRSAATTHSARKRDNPGTIILKKKPVTWFNYRTITIRRPVFIAVVVVMVRTVVSGGTRL